MALAKIFSQKKYLELINKIEGRTHYDVVHIIVLGQSLSMGYIASPICSNVKTEQAIMFKRARTQDFGYIYGITKDAYTANPSQYDNDFYSSFRPLREAKGYGLGAAWEGASPNEWETPCAGIAEGIYNAFQENDGMDIPFKVLFTAPGIGGTAIPGVYAEGGKIYDRCIKDIQKAKALCDSLGLTYKVGYIAWVQGENNYNTGTTSYKDALKSLVETYNVAIKNITGQNDGTQFVSYQTTVNKASYYNPKTQYPALAQFELSNEFDLMKIAYPIYNLQPATDNVHLTNISTRLMGNSLGRTIYALYKNKYSVFKPTEISKSGNDITLLFDRNIILDSATLVSNGVDISEIGTNAGFFAKDSSNNNITTSVELVGDRLLLIKCSSEPVKLNYGFNLPSSYTVGGFIREKEQLTGYQTNKLSLYMPVQTINL